jgi:hypothetical protein
LGEEQTIRCCTLVWLYGRTRSASINCQELHPLEPARVILSTLADITVRSVTVSQGAVPLSRHDGGFELMGIRPRLPNSGWRKGG